VTDLRTGRRGKIYFEPGLQPWGRPRGPEDLTPEDLSATFSDNAPNKMAKFWVEQLEGNSLQQFRLAPQAIPADETPGGTGPEIKTDAAHWPASAVWPGMKKSLFLEGLGDFVAVKVKAFAPRWTLADIRHQTGQAREQMRQEKLEEVAAEAAAKASLEETPHTLRYTQALRHPRLQWATRVIELWKRQPRARLTLRLHRLSSAAPEIFYVAFPLPTGETLPRLSNGGEPFVPFQDQLPGTCRDYFAVDSWAEYLLPEGRWLWVSRDAPLVAFGAAPTLALRQAPPPLRHRLLAMIFNNFWYTNFAADSHGTMEFQFDLIWTDQPGHPAQDLAEGLMAEPVVVINPAAPEDPRVIRHLYQP
jgi:hypothetical protein